MSKQRRTPRKFSQEFKLDVLLNYYQSGQSRNSVSLKYGLSNSVIARWEKEYALEDKELSLSGKLLEKLSHMRKQKSLRDHSCPPKSREEELESEILRLRKALEYSELRNEALNEVIKIGKEQLGLDLLKKAGAKR